MTDFIESIKIPREATTIHQKNNVMLIQVVKIDSKKQRYHGTGPRKILMCLAHMKNKPSLIKRVQFILKTFRRQLQKRAIKS